MKLISIKYNFENQSKSNFRDSTLIGAFLLFAKGRTNEFDTLQRSHKRRNKNHLKKHIIQMTTTDEEMHMVR